MFIQAYKKALEVLVKKPIKLWGISLLSGLLASLASGLFFGVPAVGLVVGYLISCGMAKIYIGGLKGEEPSAEQLFACFDKNFLRVAGGMAWSALWILIWGLIPIVGPIFAVIKAYSYRFVPYILATKPEVTATQAIKVSMEMTEGIKLQMFLADLCFGVGIYIVFAILGLFAMIPFLGVLFALVLIVSILAVVAFSGVFMGLYGAYFFVQKDEAVSE